MEDCGCDTMKAVKSHQLALCMQHVEALYISPDSQDLKLPAPFLHGVKDCCATNFSRFGVLPFTEKWLTWACGVPGERHMLVTIFNGQKLALSRP